MITFFRKIRQKLLSQNRVTRYLVYAIGEIILVVIGILIALQVNNWNEATKLKRQEIQLLKEMLTELRKQQQDFIFNINHHREAKEACEILLQALSNDQPYHDSLDIHFSRSYNFTILDNQQNAFAALKSKGITMIQNDSLRFLISEYYDVRMPFQIKIQEGSMKQGLEISQSHLGLFQNFAWNKSMEPWDFEELKKNRAYLSWLSFTADNRGFEMENFQTTLKRNSALIASITEELNQK
ncbi:MAG: hypothetical protein HWE15_02315 [Algoriphagus sp.]|uniref:DUF6090 family protein n=1 Tax=Algoriphagus sp. TaxID=1872435 RepID=UPI0017C90864|nr:DUF6090 family protein [Algoriphagus sp.]NVJ85106.1 hypothetical protein [Algoriphagus sp.]